MAAGGSERVVYTALVANFGISVSKLAVGLATGSTAMLAEAAHSFADTINQVFLLVSLRLSDNPADENHPVRIWERAVLLGVSRRRLHLRRRGILFVLPGIRPIPPSP